MSGSKSSETNPQIPDEWQSYLTPLVQQQLQMLGSFGQAGWQEMMGGNYEGVYPRDPREEEDTQGDENKMAQDILDDNGDPVEVQRESDGDGGFTYDDYDPDGFWGDHSRNVADMDPWEQWAADQAMNLESPEQWGRIREFMENSGAMTPEWQAALGRAQNMNLLPSQTRQAVSESGSLNFLTPEHRAALGLYNDIGELSSRQVQYDPQSDRAFHAANDAFDASIQPLIENQAALSGLGRSTSMNAATAAQKSQTLLPLIQAGQGRAERRIDRMLGGGIERARGISSIGDTRRAGEMARLDLLQNVGQMDDSRQRFMVDTEMGAGDRRAQRNTEYMTNLMQLGDRESELDRARIDYGAGFGGLRRGIEQEGYDAEHNDWLRRAGAFENTLYPWQSNLGGLFGAESTQGKK